MLPLFKKVSTYYGISRSGLKFVLKIINEILVLAPSKSELKTVCLLHKVAKFFKSFRQ